MKRFRQLLMLIVAVALCCSVMIGNISFIAGAASADPTTVDLTANTGSVDTIVRKATIGTPVDVKSADMSVVDPLGEAVVLSGTSFTPKMIGYYTVKFVKDDNSYDGFKVLVEADKAEVLIPQKGASIPTFVKIGSTVTLPAAAMVVYDEKGEVDTVATADANAKYAFEVSYINEEGTSTILAAAESKYTFVTNKDTAASYTVRYKASNSTNGTVLYKDYTVKAQKEYDDTEKPTLNIVNVPGEANQRVKVTLPIATATDASDANVLIEVTVKGPDGKPVKAVNDKDEKNLVVLESDVAFDNDKTMSFYPLETGAYKVNYKATDDSGNITEVGKLITVKDNKAPTIEIKEENKIPTTWGLQVYKYDQGNTEGVEVKNAKIFMPAATVWDNVTLTPEQAVVSLTIKDPKGTVFYDSTNADKSGANVPSVIYDVENKTYTFEPNNYDPSDGAAKIGEYVVTYRAYDARKLESTKTYRIDVKATFKDLQNPIITVEGEQEIVWKGEDFTKPSISAYDADNARTYIDTKYEFSTDGTNFTEFTEEQMADLDKDGKLKMETAGKIQITINAADQAGNVAVNKIVKVNVLDESVGAAPSITAGKATTTVFDDTLTGDKNRNYKTKEKVKLIAAPADNIIITSAVNAEEYLGFEIFVLNPSGKAVEAEVKLASKVGVAGAKSTVTVSGITFTPAIKGTYKATVRGFSLSGASVINTFDVIIDADESDVPLPPVETASFVKTASTYAGSKDLEVYTPATLRSYAERAGETLTRTITGPRAELKGNIFTPKEIGTYTVATFYVNDVTGTAGTPVLDTYTAVNTTAPVVKVLSDYESYKAKFSYKAYSEEYVGAPETWTPDQQLAAAIKHMVEIPTVSVTNVSGAVKVTKKVTPPRNAEPQIETFKGRDFFRPSEDGEYTVVYTVKDGYNTTTFSDIKISVGDIVMPTMSIGRKPNATYKIGAKIKFGDVTVSDGEKGTASADIIVTKSIIGPSGTVLHTESGAASSDTEYTLDKAGTYIVRYEAKDFAGNTAVEEFKFTVTAKTSGGVSYQVISTVLIVVAVCLIIGLLTYFFAFRRIDGDKIRNKQNKQ